MPEQVVLGIGLSTSATTADCLALVADIVPDDWAITAISSLDAKRDQVQPVADALSVPLVCWSAEELAGVDVPNPSNRALAETGTSSVAEASALLGSDGGVLLIAKTAHRGATVAVARVSDAPRVDTR